MKRLISTTHLFINLNNIPMTIDKLVFTASIDGNGNTGEKDNE